MDKTAKPQYLSRSALAEKLGVTLKELTQLLIESGWLVHNEKAEKGKEWTLTAKGEFEGGIFRESKKFGQYIVWPESVLSHPAITGLTESLISATQIAKHFSTSSQVVSAKLVNKLLADLGWLSAFAKGWQVTEQGSQQGGVQDTYQETGVPYVMWSRALLDSPILVKHIRCYQGDLDLIPHHVFDDVHYYQTLNGSFVHHLSELVIANTLYLANIPYAYQRDVSVNKELSLRANFYLPNFSFSNKAISIFFNDNNVQADRLAEQLRRSELIQTHKLPAIELNPSDIENIDQVLSKALIHLGVVTT